MKKARTRSERRKSPLRNGNHVLLIDETLAHCENVVTIARLLRALSGAPEFLEPDLVARAGAMILEEMQAVQKNNRSSDSASRNSEFS